MKMTPNIKLQLPSGVARGGGGGGGGGRGWERTASSGGKIEVTPKNLEREKEF